MIRLIATSRPWLVDHNFQLASKALSMYWQSPVARTPFPTCDIHTDVLRDRATRRDSDLCPTNVFCEVKVKVEGSRQLW